MMIPYRVIGWERVNTCSVRTVPGLSTSLWEYTYRQRCTLETWHMRSQAHPLNREEGILPHVYDALVHNTARVHGPPISRQN